MTPKGQRVGWLLAAGLAVILFATACGGGDDSGGAGDDDGVITVNWGSRAAVARPGPREDTTSSERPPEHHGPAREARGRGWTPTRTSPRAGRSDGATVTFKLPLGR